MNSIINLAAIILIVFGVIGLSYSGIKYTTQAKIVEIGSVKVTANTDKTIHFPSISGGICLAVGFGLLLIRKVIG